MFLFIAYSVIHITSFFQLLVFLVCWFSCYFRLLSVFGSRSDVWSFDGLRYGSIFSPVDSQAHLLVIFFVTWDKVDVTSKFLLKSTSYSIVIFPMIHSFVISMSSLNLVWYGMPNVPCSVSVPVIVATNLPIFSQAGPVPRRELHTIPWGLSALFSISERQAVDLNSHRLSSCH